jgi:hypothetical protein
MKIRYSGAPPYCVNVQYGNGSKRPLPMRKDIYHHSNEFCWGYGGSGPGQLAMALLIHALRDVKKAKRLYQQFKWRYVARLEEGAPWEISRDEIRRIVDEIESKNAE